MFATLLKDTFLSAFHTHPPPDSFNLFHLSTPSLLSGIWPLRRQTFQLREDVDRYFCNSFERYIRFGRISAVRVGSTFTSSVMQPQCVFVTHNEHRKYSHYRPATRVSFSFLSSDCHYALVSRNEQNMTVFTSVLQAAPCFRAPHRGRKRRVKREESALFVSSLNLTCSEDPVHCDCTM